MKCFSLFGLVGLSGTGVFDDSCLPRSEVIMDNLDRNQTPGLAHVQFETIHPFLDGNGRLGRLLITFMLCASGALREPSLYLSLYLKTHRETYYELLTGVRSKGDWEKKLEFFLTTVKETSDRAVNSARRIMLLTDSDRRKIESTGRVAASVLRFFQHVQTNPILAIASTAQKTGMSFPTVSNAIKDLERLGILKEITGKQRSRLFTYDRYLAILSEGTEPIRKFITRDEDLFSINITNNLIPNPPPAPNRFFDIVC